MRFFNHLAREGAGVADASTVDFVTADTDVASLGCPLKPEALDAGGCWVLDREKALFTCWVRMENWTTQVPRPPSGYPPCRIAFKVITPPKSKEETVAKTTTEAAGSPERQSFRERRSRLNEATEAYRALKLQRWNEKRERAAARRTAFRQEKVDRIRQELRARKGAQASVEQARKVPVRKLTRRERSGDSKVKKSIPKERPADPDAAAPTSIEENPVEKSDEAPPEKGLVVASPVEDVNSVTLLGLLMEQLVGRVSDRFAALLDREPRRTLKAAEARPCRENRGTQCSEEGPRVPPTKSRRVLRKCRESREVEKQQLRRDIDELAQAVSLVTKAVAKLTEPGDHHASRHRTCEAIVEAAVRQVSDFEFTLGR